MCREPEEAVASVVVAGAVWDVQSGEEDQAQSAVSDLNASSILPFHDPSSPRHDILRPCLIIDSYPLHSTQHNASTMYFYHHLSRHASSRPIYPFIWTPLYFVVFIRSTPAFKHLYHFYVASSIAFFHGLYGSCVQQFTLKVDFFYGIYCSTTFFSFMLFRLEIHPY